MQDRLFCGPGAGDLRSNAFLRTLFPKGKKMIDTIKFLTSQIVSWAAALLELIFVIVLIYIVVKAMILFVRKDPEAMDYLGSGINHSLSFLMVSEILKTVIYETIQDFTALAICVGLRVFFSWVNSREIAARHKEHEQNLSSQHK
jgi:uncharacterized membrane protein